MKMPGLIDPTVFPNEVEDLSAIAARGAAAGVLSVHAIDPFDTSDPERLRQALRTGRTVTAHIPDDERFAHESVVSFRYGLPAQPVSAETSVLARDLAVCADVPGARAGRYVYPALSSAAGVELIRCAKASGLNVAAGVSLHHLLLNVIDTVPFRTDTKLTPPLREESDRLALIAGVADGTIDFVSSRHRACTRAQKHTVPAAAAFGAADIEHLLPAVLRLHFENGLPLPTVLAAVTSGPAAVFDLPLPGEITVDLKCAFRCAPARDASPVSALTGRMFEGRAVTGRA